MSLRDRSRDEITRDCLSPEISDSQSERAAMSDGLALLPESTLSTALISITKDAVSKSI